jgi:ribosomal protein S12 methylthiotransferase accessory factor
MINRPRLNPVFHVEVVEPEGVYLLSERGHFVLKGPLHCRLAPLLDGLHTIDEIVDELAPEAALPEIYYALGQLERKGYVVEGGALTDRDAFWYALGLEARSTEERLTATPVALACFGAVPRQPVEAALTALGFSVAASGRFALAVTDDYLRAELADYNAAAHAAATPWLLVKPVGTVVWIGPVFRPGHTGCWECLAHRLRGNREIETYLQQKRGIPEPLPSSQPAFSASLQAALALAALEVAKAVGSSDRQATEATVTTCDLQTLETRKHQLVRRAQCPRCGDPRGRTPVPLTLHSQKKGFTADGGHRTISPERTVATYQHHVSPVTGAVSSLVRVGGDAAGLLNTYFAGHNVGLRYPDYRSLRHGLLKKSGGKGMTDAQARASGLCEGLERYSGTFQGDEVGRRATRRELGSAAVHPNGCMLFSERQYRRRREWNSHVSRYLSVPEPFDDDAVIDWTLVWSFTGREFRYVPTGYCYYGYPMPAAQQFFWPDSNGVAAGNCLEEAILQGFCELAERDAVCVWWYNRLRRPAVDLGSFHEPYLNDVVAQYRQFNREIWALDLTHDLGIPTFAALSRRTDQAQENTIVGFGAHFDPRIGLLRAITELNQSAAWALGARGDPDHEDDPVQTMWWNTAALSNQLYLVPSREPPRSRADFVATSSDDFREDVLRCQAIVERHGMELLVLDQTRPDVGLSVVRVIVPGLRHFWPRFAPGRLYDVPVELGWLDRALAEDQLNPIPIFI